MKFLKEHLATIGGIEWYPIIGLLIFMAIFLGALLWAFRTSKEKIQTLSEMPLED